MTQCLKQIPNKCLHENRLQADVHEIFGCKNHMKPKSFWPLQQMSRSLGKWNLPLNLKNNQIPMINISIVPRSCIHWCTWDKMLNSLLTVFYWRLITPSQDLYPKNHFSFWQYSFIYQISSYNYQIRKMTKKWSIL